MEDAVTPLPIPLITPPVTTTNFFGIPESVANDDWIGAVEEDKLRKCNFDRIKLGTGRNWNPKETMLNVITRKTPRPQFAGGIMIKCDSLIVMKFAFKKWKVRLFKPAVFNQKDRNGNRGNLHIYLFWLRKLVTKCKFKIAKVLPIFIFDLFFIIFNQIWVLSSFVCSVESLKEFHHWFCKLGEKLLMFQVTSRGCSRAYVVCVLWRSLEYVRKLYASGNQITFPFPDQDVEEWLLIARVDCNDEKFQKMLGGIDYFPDESSTYWTLAVHFFTW